MKVLGTCADANPWASRPYRAPALQPRLNVLAKPQASSTSSEVNYRPRHVRILVQVLADRVPMGEADDSGDIVVLCFATHNLGAAAITVVLWPSELRTAEPDLHCLGVPKG